MLLYIETRRLQDHLTRGKSLPLETFHYKCIKKKKEGYTKKVEKYNPGGRMGTSIEIRNARVLGKYWLLSDETLLMPCEQSRR